MQPIQILRLAAVTLLLTAGFPLLPVPDFLLPAAAQTAQDGKAEDDRKASQETNRALLNKNMNLSELLVSSPPKSPNSGGL